MEKSASFNYHLAMQAALTMPEGVANFLPPEPTAVMQARLSGHTGRGKGALDVDAAGLVNMECGSRCRTLSVS